MRRAALLVPLVASISGCGAGSEQLRTYRMNERVQAGPLIYSALETHWFLTLGSAENGRLPANRFLVVRMAIRNAGAVDSGIPTLILVDDKGQTFNELTDGTGVPNWLGIVRKIHPVDSQDGTAVFDVPPRHYRLRVADETDQIASYIDLPLNFVSDDRGQ